MLPGSLPLEQRVYGRSLLYSLCRERWYRAIFHGVPGGRGGVRRFRVAAASARAYAPRFKSSTFMGVVFAETVRGKPHKRGWKFLVIWRLPAEYGGNCIQEIATILRRREPRRKPTRIFLLCARMPPGFGPLFFSQFPSRGIYDCSALLG